MLPRTYQASLMVVAMSLGIYQRPTHGSPVMSMFRTGPAAAHARVYSGLVLHVRLRSALGLEGAPIPTLSPFMPAASWLGCEVLEEGGRPGAVVEVRDLICSRTVCGCVMGSCMYAWLHKELSAFTVYQSAQWCCPVRLVVSIIACV